MTVNIKQRLKHGLFHFKRLPFGLVNASAVFTIVIYKVFHDLPFLETHIDDFVIHSVTIDLMFEYLNTVMLRKRKYNLRVNWKKCQWFNTLRMTYTY